MRRFMILLSLFGFSAMLLVGVTPAQADAPDEVPNWAVAAAASSEAAPSHNVCVNVCPPGLVWAAACAWDQTNYGCPAVGVGAAEQLPPPHRSSSRSAVQATGPADQDVTCVPGATRSWAPHPHHAGPEQLTLSYEPVTGATRIDIYETFNSGFVTQVDLLTVGEPPTTVFTGPDTTSCGDILSIPIAPSGPVVGVVVTTNSAQYLSIDAVSVVS